MCECSDQCREVALWYITVEKEEGTQAVESTHHLGDRGRKGTLPRSSHAIYPQNLLSVVRVIRYPLHNVFNDVKPCVFKTSGAFVFVHIGWFQHLITCWVETMRHYKMAEDVWTRTHHIDGGRCS